MMRKTGYLMMAVAVITLLLIIKNISKAEIYAYEICTLKEYVVGYGSGDEYYWSTHQYWDCVTYYLYLWDGGGGGGNNEGGVGSDGDIEDPGGGGGSVINPFDKNNDGIIDCFVGNLMHRSDLLVSSCYGWRCIDGDCKMHQGVDIAVPAGAQSIRGELIYSLTDGVITEIGYSSGYGNFIKIKDRNGYIWIYAHLQTDPRVDMDINLDVGNKVNMGITIIGKCDSTGDSKGDHIHVELRIGTGTVDPLGYIGIGGCDYEKTGSNC